MKHEGLILFSIIIVSFFMFQSNPGLITHAKTDGVSEIRCDSDSMGMTLNCDQRVRWHYVKSDEALKTGSLYIYDDPWTNDTLILHRLVGCLAPYNDTIIEDCTLYSFLIFKGDNNRVMDIPVLYSPKIKLRYVDIIYSD